MIKRRDGSEKDIPSSVNEALLAAAERLPSQAGVYLFRGRKSEVLYVGKAKNLRARVRQYVSLTDERFMVPYLMRAAVTVEVVATDTEKEALLLENTLIKKHRPKYNTQLRDDKAFLHLRLDVKGPWPRWLLVRRIQDDGARYFGPYTSASRARQTLQVLQRHFPLRTCTDAVLNSRTRPCILHQMHRCVAPCVGLATADDYGQLAEESMMFLQGRTRPLIQRLQLRMVAAADAERFEDAARHRDLIRSVEASLERQKVVDVRGGDRDIWGVFRAGSRGAVAIVPVRDGLMLEPIVAAVGGLVGEDDDVLSSLLNDAYPAGADLPDEILLPSLPSDAAALEEVLSERRGRRVALRTPVRGDKARLVELAAENARLRFARDHDEAEQRQRALAELARIVEMPNPPHRIECFDNSHTQGDQPVAAMSVFLDGQPARAEYRRYRIKTAKGGDDYGGMREILERRIVRAEREGTLPDLLIVDGGRGQLNVAVAVLHDLGKSTLPVIGIVKPRTEHRKGERDATDKIVHPNYKDPIALAAHEPALRLVQYLRDEVHKHAVGYHRQVRGREQLISLLEAIPGVGKTRRVALIKHLGSARAVLEADVATLAEVPGIGDALATAIYAELHAPQPEA
jgi:excinuclease ABC subunit C